MADAAPHTCTIDDVGPMPLSRVASVAELSDLVRQCAADGRPLFPLGGRTHLHVGMPPERPGVAVDLTALNGVIDYPARDMTVTVQAGITLAALRRLLAAERQRLPVDVPRPEDATLGGALAVNAGGPRRYGWGTFRDYVIGLSAVNDQGVETKSGGRVVKNVAGYDLHKLHIGALGTLGVITQVTLKLRPLPEASALLAVGCEGEDLGPLLDALHASRTRPVCIDVLNAAAANAAATASGLALPAAPWLIVAGYEESAEAVSWQVRQGMGELPAPRLRGLAIHAGPLDAPLWDALTELTDPVTEVTLQAAVLPGSSAALCRRAAALAEGAVIQAHAGSGVVRLHLGGLTSGRVHEMLKELQAAAAPARGRVTVPRCPAAWKRELPVWGPPGGDWPLMRRVKQSLDPRRLFNPGRLAGVI